MRLGWVSNSHKPMICSQMCSGLNYAAWLAIVSRILLKCRPHPVPLAPFEINDPSIVNLNRVLIVTDEKINARNFLKSDCFYYYTPLLLLSSPPPPPPPHFLSPATQKVVVYYVLPSELFECPFISSSAHQFRTLTWVVFDIFFKLCMDIDIREEWFGIANVLNSLIYIRVIARAAAIYCDTQILQYSPWQYAVLYWRRLVCCTAIRASRWDFSV